MQKDLLERARKFRDENTFAVKTYAEFKKQIEAPGGFFRTSWCGNRVCEEKMKEETKATIRCLELDSQYQTKPSSDPCLVCGQGAQNRQVLVAKSY